MAKLEVQCHKFQGFEAQNERYSWLQVRLCQTVSKLHILEMDSGSQGNSRKINILRLSVPYYDDISSNDS